MKKEPKKSLALENTRMHPAKGHSSASWHTDNSEAEFFELTFPGGPAAATTEWTDGVFTLCKFENDNIS